MNLRYVPPLLSGVAISSVDAAFPQLLLTPLLVVAVLLAGLLLSPRITAVLALVAAACAVPLGAADHIFGSVAQIWILAAILLSGSIATRISLRRRCRTGDC